VPSVSSTTTASTARSSARNTEHCRPAKGRCGAPSAVGDPDRGIRPRLAVATPCPRPAGPTNESGAGRSDAAAARPAAPAPPGPQERPTASVERYRRPGARSSSPSASDTRPGLRRLSPRSAAVAAAFPRRSAADTPSSRAATAFNRCEPVLGGVHIA